MAMVVKELKSNSLSNIVFLDLLLYHTGLKQSRHYPASSPAIDHEITFNQVNKTVINKIKFIDSQLAFRNLFPVIFIKKAFISTITNKFYYLLLIFGLYYFIPYKKTLVIFLTAFPLGCININELKGPGSGGGRRPQLIYVHRDDVVYWASSRVSIKGTMVLVEINKKVGYKKSSQIDTAARGLLLKPLPINPFYTQKTRIHILYVNHHLQGVYLG
jgi:hypothetical protein